MNELSIFYTESSSLVWGSKSQPVADFLISQGYEVVLPEAIKKKVPGRKESVLVGFLKHGKIMPFCFPDSQKDLQQNEVYKGLKSLIEQYKLPEFSSSTIFI
jgi:hypothetical protein